MADATLKRGDSLKGTFNFNQDISNGVVLAQVRNSSLTLVKTCETAITDAAAGQGVLLVKNTTDLIVGEVYSVDTQVSVDGVVTSTPTKTFEVVQDISYE